MHKELKPFAGSLEDVRNLMVSALHQENWHADRAMSESRSELMEYFYIKLMEITKKMISQGACGYFYLIVPPNIMSLIESNFTHCFESTKERFFQDGQFKLGPDLDFYIREIGILSQKWRVYIGKSLNEEMLLGVGPVSGPPTDFARIKLHGFSE